MRRRLRPFLHRALLHGVLLSGALLVYAPAFPAAQPAGPPKPISEEWKDDPPKAEATCETYDLRYAAAPLFRIVAAGAGGRVHLHTKREACRDSMRCPHRKASYLVAGDIVFAGPSDKGFRCAYFGTAAGGLIAGFIADGNLAGVVLSEADATVSADFLIGTWRDAANTIKVTRAGPERVKIDAEGLYRGISSVNIGGFGYQGPVAANKAVTIRDDGCIVVLERRGPYLLVNDNAQCGGHNVRFVGIYVRRTAR